jgi:hypothetical protein
LLFALRERSFSLLAIDLALLSFTNLPITVRTHPLGERVPIETELCTDGADSLTGRSARGGRSCRSRTTTSLAML